MDFAFRATAGSVDVTPQWPVPLGRFYDAHKPTTLSADPLEANAVVLSRGEEVCVFLSFDLMYVGTELREAIAARLAAQIGSERLFVSASHTHFAPATDRHLPGIGPVSDDYLAWVAERTAGLVGDLLAKPGRAASVSLTKGMADHAINRRLRVLGLRRRFPPLWKHWEMRPNPQGPRDETIRMLVVHGESGAPLAICWGYGCHAVCYPHRDRFSADYPGVVRRALRAAYGPIPIVFWQGFSGDVRPRIVKPAERGRFGLMRPPAFDQFTDEGWERWSESLAERVVEISRGRGRPVKGGIRCARWTVPLAELGPRTEGRDLNVQEVMLGDDLRIFGISAEIVVGYVDVLARSRAPADVIPVGCIDGVPGYLPTSDMVAQGGYEAGGFMRLFRVRGGYRPDVTDAVERLVFRSPAGVAS